MASIIGNIGPAVESSGVIRNGTKDPQQGWTWSYGDSLPNGAVGANDQITPVPNDGNIYFYPSLGNRYGYDTGMRTLLLSPVGGKTEVAPLNGSTHPITITFTTLNSNPGGSGIALLYVELNGVVLVNSTTNSSSFVLSLGESEAGWILANGGALTFRMYTAYNANPGSASASVVVSDGGLLYANVV